MASLAPIALAEKLLTLLDQGAYSTTYKYAVLLALIDACLEHARADGTAPTSLTTLQLADRVLALYWPHAVPFPARDPAGSLVLRQSGSGQAEIVTRITSFRTRHAPDPSCTLAQARAASRAQFEQLRRFVEWKLVEMPLPRLQEIGGQTEPFLYRIGWDASIKRSTFTGPDFDNRVLLLPGVGEALVQLSTLVRTLIHREWTAMIQRLNDAVLPESRLEAFLFGSERIDAAPVREPLRGLQAGRCFYCEQPIRGIAEVDHFIPWSRHPDNGIHNLVLADRKCNGDKRAFLASAAHVSRWKTRIDAAGEALGRIALDCAWESDGARTLSVARAIYLRLPADVKLWQQSNTFVDADVSVLHRALAG